MGKYKHHSGAIGGGVNLSKGKTPHDSLMKYMPVDDKASGLFKMAKPFEMGVSMRGPLDKHGMHKGPDMYGKKHDGPNAYGKIHKGPNKMDPMYNGKPGVQKDDFEQFASPASKKEPKRVKIESEGSAGQGSTEYVRGSRDGDKNTRSVEIGKDYGGDQRKTVRRKKKDGTTKTKSKKISDKKAERIKKRKDKSHTSQ